MTSIVSTDNLCDIIQYIPYDYLYKLSRASCIFDQLIFNRITTKIGMIIFKGNILLQSYDHLKDLEYKIIRLLDDIYFLGPGGLREFGSNRVYGFFKPYEIYDNVDIIPTSNLYKISVNTYGNVALFHYSHGPEYFRLCRMKSVKKSIEGIKINDTEFTVNNIIHKYDTVYPESLRFILEDTCEAFFAIRHSIGWDNQRYCEKFKHICHLVSFDVLWAGHSGDQ